MSHIHVDVRNVPGVPGISPLGLPVFVYEFEMICIYGGTAEIKAQIAWKEDVRLCNLCLTTYVVLTNSPLFHRAWRSGVSLRLPVTNFLIGVTSLLYMTTNKMFERQTRPNLRDH